MFSRLRERFARSAAWPLSVRPTVVFAVATMAAVAIMYALAARSIREHNDAWLRGEVEVLRQVSTAAPPGAAYAGVIRAIAESAAEEVTQASRAEDERNAMTFFLYTDADRRVVVWLGPETRDAFVSAVRTARLPIGSPRTVAVRGQSMPFRVVREKGADGSEIFLGLSDIHAVRLMETLLARLGMVWTGAVCLAWLISFGSARRMLARVESITDAAARIRSDDLSSRVPEGRHGDEIARLARTFNGMLDRVADSVNQLRTLTDTVAHELKSPITSIRARLESALVREAPGGERETMILALEDLDRLAAFIATTLDVTEAEGGGLRLHRTAVDFSDLVRQLLALYEPALADRGQTVDQSIADGIVASVDSSLMRRALANLLDNELSHPRPGTRVRVALTTEGAEIALRIDDDGAGFPTEVETRMFGRFVKGTGSGGHGLGLAFCRAIVVAHGGRMVAGNRPAGGAFVKVTLPLPASS